MSEEASAVSRLTRMTQVSDERNGVCVSLSDDRTEDVEEEWDICRKSREIVDQDVQTINNVGLFATGEHFCSK